MFERADSIASRRDPRQLMRPVPTVSAVLDDGSVVETIYRPDERRTAFVISRDGKWQEAPSIETGGRRLLPYSPGNNLLRNRVVLLPSGVEEYGTEADLVNEVRDFIHRYVDVSPLFEQLTAYYVLLSWVYDAFSELPYLRVRGDFGSGKTRFLLTVGAICYKPIFASGASTVSPLFRLLDTFRGTLIIDEGDFRFSDEKAEVIKILNNGSGRGFPVLRSEATGRGEFNPRAYHVFGPKLVATRGFFDDRALESRCVTEELGQRRLRDDVPISLPKGYQDEASTLRSKLLLFRFRNVGHQGAREDLVDRTIEPRLNQVFVPLLSVIDDESVRRNLRDLARRYQRELVADRGMDAEAQVLEVASEILGLDGEAKLSIKEITGRFAERYGDEYERKITNRWIGWIVRRRFGLKPMKSHGTFVLPVSEIPKLKGLCERYGVGLPQLDEAQPTAGTRHRQS